MARPQKFGLDYFPMDCHLDKNLKAIIRKFNAEGFGVVVGLFQHIYSEGYYIEWNEETSEDFSLEFGVDEEILSSIINFCTKRNVFNFDLFNSEKILTSRGIQKRYLIATERRKCKQLPLFNLINVDNNTVNVNNNQVNVNISTQSKVKESKRKETIYSFDDFWNDYDKKKSKPKCEKKYSKINESDRELIKNNLPLYISSTPDKKFRKDPLTWLNGECWGDDIDEPVKSDKDKDLEEQARYFFGGTELESLGLDIIKGQSTI